MRSLPVLLLFTLLAANPADADPVRYTAVLWGSAENPPNTSSAVGVALVGYDAASRALEVLAGFTGLTTPTSAAHIHCCIDPPDNVGVATPVPTFPGFPSGVTSGVYAHLLDLTSPASFSPAFLAAAGGTPMAAELALAQGLALGRAYFNIHTAGFPGGEIRGFLTATSPPDPIPEPATLLLVGGAFGGLAVVRRRRSRRPRR